LYYLCHYNNPAIPPYLKGVPAVSSEKSEASIVAVDVDPPVGPSSPAKLSLKLSAVNVPGLI